MSDMKWACLICNRRNRYWLLCVVIHIKWYMKGKSGCKFFLIFIYFKNKMNMSNKISSFNIWGDDCDRGVVKSNLLDLTTIRPIWLVIFLWRNLCPLFFSRCLVIRLELHPRCAVRIGWGNVGGNSYKVWVVCAL